jgi:hypothetical protein
MNQTTMERINLYIRDLRMLQLQKPLKNPKFHVNPNLPQILMFNLKNVHKIKNPEDDYEKLITLITVS